MTQTAKSHPVAASVSKALRKQAAELARPESGSSEMYRRAFGQEKLEARSERSAQRREAKPVAA